MNRQARHAYLRQIQVRYRAASRVEKTQILDEFCHVTGYHRKYAVRLLNTSDSGRQASKAGRRKPIYGANVVRALAAIWEAAGYPWSVRLKALLPLWLPWARKRG